MPFWPERLYELSLRDEQVTWLDPLLQAAEISGLLLGETPEVTIPTARCLLLQHVTATADPGAGQIVNSLVLVLNAPLPEALAIILRADVNPAAANIVQELTWQGSLLVPPGWRVGAQSVFNAAAVANVTRVNVGGLLIPSGNIQRV